jgi:CMP-N-acetylneuraminic acid synthetase
VTNILGLIPARGGSSGIPRKNIVLLSGRPLLAYTCEAALGSRSLTRVALSTDDEEIAQVGRECGVEVPFRRPAELAQADSSSLAVAEHAVLWLGEREGWHADVLVLLQPTSPLRQARHIDEALEQMASAGADSVVSVVVVPHRFSPYLVMRREDGGLREFWPEPVPFDRFRRQELPPLYAPNGPAILGSQTRTLFECQSFYGRRLVPYVMSDEDSIDIDTPFDLEFAEWILERRNADLREAVAQRGEPAAEAPGESG